MTTVGVIYTECCALRREMFGVQLCIITCDAEALVNFYKVKCTFSAVPKETK